ncbi:MAG: hypothetical protein MRQ10_05910 [Candidatus Midichloria mitochondrii]|nr:hypothetical protein [Candidatus Midichloria mitochondrii]MDJ1288738.1 hypothetical protein [Candidatus Midichloria mitochondrii]MDJ1299563.1 hypothetical protein [Candidatus Midichloria mitochondrii]
MIAFALRPNQIKYRDLWDTSRGGPHGQAIKPRLELITHKLKDRNYPIDHFLKTFNERKNFLETRLEMAKEFRQGIKSWSKRIS